MPRNAAPRPVRIYVPSADLQTTIVRGIGFKVACECGDSSGRLRSYRRAREWARAHRDVCQKRTEPSQPEKS